MRIFASLGLVLIPACVWGLDLVVKTKPAKPGEETSLSLVVHEAEAVGNLAFEVSYDWDKLSLLGVRQGSLIEGLSGAVFAMNPERFPDRSGVFKFNIVVAGGFGGGGNVMEFKFGISDSARGLVEVKVKGASAADTSLGAIEVRAQNGGFILPVSVSEEEVLIPSCWALLPNFPNPFNEGTWIPFQVPKEGKVEVRIYNILGQVVRRIDLGSVPAGYYLGVGRAVYWDGRDEDGRILGSGVYLVKFKAGDFVDVRKAVLLR